MTDFGTNAEDAPVLRFADVSRIHEAGTGRVVSLEHADLTLHAGEFVAIMGPSGSGKSTLLNLAGGLDLPTEGRVFVDGVDLTKLDAARRAMLRRRLIGYVFQDYNLLPIYALAQPDAESTMNLTGKAYDDIYAQYPTVKALLAAELHCEVNERQQYGQDMASAFDPNSTPYCVNWSKSYEVVGYTGLSMINMDSSVIIMSADAMRMTGFPNAEQAARTLEEGGVVVGNAAALREDNTVALQVSHRTLDDDGNSGSERVVRQSVRKATWIKGFYPLAMSERTAHDLGIVNLRYVGDIAALDHVHGWSTIERLHKATSDMPLVSMTSQRYQYEWATNADGAKITLAPIVALGLLALTATVVSLLLSRTQTIRDMTTMHAVGASPGFLRRLGLVQAMTILLPGVPLGMIAGIALGCYHVAWYRRIGIDGA